MQNMNFRQVDLNLLVIFDEVANCRSVTVAAGRLNLSQPAVSHALSRLRHLLDDPLFVRGKGGLSLTLRALELVEPVRQVLDAAKRALTPKRFDPLVTPRRFRLGASEYTALTLLPALVPALHGQAPCANFAFEAIDETTFDRLSNGDIDAVFWGARPPEAPFCSVELFRETQVGAVGTRHPLVDKIRAADVSLADYLAYPHLRVNYAAGIPSLVDMALTSLDRARRIAVETASFGNNIALLRDTQMVLTLPSRLFRNSEPGLVVTFALPFEVPDFVYHLLWHRRTETDPGAVWLRNQIIGAVQERLA